MAETRTAVDPFDGKTVEIRNDLRLRLRGKYATGPTLPNGEPEFGWMELPVPPIEHEAADEIERLEIELAKERRTNDRLRALLKEVIDDTSMYKIDPKTHARIVQALTGRESK